jgi:hypothetical protein
VDSALVRLAGPRESADDEDLDAATAARLPVRTAAVENGGCDPVWEGGSGGRLVIPYALALVKSGADLAAPSPDAGKAAAESDAVDVSLSVELWNENAVSDDLIGVQASLDLTGMLNSKVRVAPRTMLCQCCANVVPLLFCCCTGTALNMHALQITDASPPAVAHSCAIHHRAQTLEQQLATPTWYGLEPAGRVLLSIRYEANAPVSLPPPPPVERRRTTAAGAMLAPAADGMRAIAALSTAEVGALLSHLQLERYRDALQSANFDGAKLAVCCEGVDDGDGNAGDDALRVAGVSFGAHRAKLRRAVADMVLRGGVERAVVEQQRASIFSIF